MRLVGVGTTLAHAAHGTAPQGAVVSGSTVLPALVPDVLPLEFHLDMHALGWGFEAVGVGGGEGGELLENTNIKVHRYQVCILGWGMGAGGEGDPTAGI